MKCELRLLRVRYGLRVCVLKCGPLRRVTKSWDKFIVIDGVGFVDCGEVHISFEYCTLGGDTAKGGTLGRGAGTTSGTLGCGAGVGVVDGVTLGGIFGVGDG